MTDTKAIKNARALVINEFTPWEFDKLLKKNFDTHTCNFASTSDSFPDQVNNVFSHFEQMDNCAALIKAVSRVKPRRRYVRSILLAGLLIALAFTAWPVATWIRSILDPVPPKPLPELPKTKTDSHKPDEKSPKTKTDSHETDAESYKTDTEPWITNAHTGKYVYCIGLSPSEKWLVTAGGDNRVVCWEAATGKKRGEFTLEPKLGWIAVLEFRPISDSRSDTREEFVIGDNAGTIAYLSLAPNGQLTRMWSKTRKELKFFEDPDNSHPLAISCFAFSKNSQRLLVGANAVGQPIEKWVIRVASLAVDTGEDLQQWTYPSPGVVALKYTAGNVFWAVSRSGIVFKTQTQIKSPEARGSIGLSPTSSGNVLLTDKRIIEVLSNKGQLSTYVLADLKDSINRPLSTPCEGANLAISRDGTDILLGCGAQFRIIRGVLTDAPLKEILVPIPDIKADTQFTTSVGAFGKDGTVFIADKDGNIWRSTKVPPE